MPEPNTHNMTMYTVLRLFVTAVSLSFLLAKSIAFNEHVTNVHAWSLEMT